MDINLSQRGARKEIDKMSKHTLYEIIKDKLSYNTRKKLEKQIEYNDFLSSQKRYKEKGE